jgi:hypothetical protein
VTVLGDAEARAGGYGAAAMRLTCGLSEPGEPVGANLSGCLRTLGVNEVVFLFGNWTWPCDGPGGVSALRAIGPYC